MSISALHKAARAYAAAGIPIFPCVEDGKQPACANSFKDATCDLAWIDARWTENPNYNVAMCPEDAGLCIVDLDPPTGIENWQAQEGEKPPTRVIQTPRGGEHWYYEGSLPPTSGKLAEKIDTRGRGSYVLVPPSIVGGKPYRVLHDRDIAPLPAWIGTRLAEGSSRVAAASDDLDRPANLARARTYLHDCIQRGHIAIQDRHGDDLTYRTACVVQNFGISVETCRDLLAEIWNPHCVPPWSPDELLTKCTNALNHSQNEPGAWAVTPAAENFGPALDTLAKEQPPEKPNKFQLIHGPDLKNLPPPRWLIKDLLQEGSVTMLVGLPGTFKSYLALDIGFGIATSTVTFGQKIEGENNFVVYAAGEGYNLTYSRMNAWMVARGISAEPPNFCLTETPMIILDDEVTAFGAEISKVCEKEKRDPQLIIIDTAAQTMIGLNENDPRDVGRFTKFCQRLARDFHCTVLGVHHFGKDVSKGMRGHSQFIGNVDGVLNTEADDILRTVSVKVGKQRGGEKRQEPWTFQGKKIAGDLAFFPTTADEHAVLTKDDSNILDPRNVGAALKALGAIGVEHGVSRAVLASQLVTPVAGESTDARQATLNKIARKLGVLKNTKLVGYVEQVGNQEIWCLPMK